MSEQTKQPEHLVKPDSNNQIIKEKTAVVLGCLSMLAITGGQAGVILYLGNLAFGPIWASGVLAATAIAETIAYVSWSGKRQNSR